MVSNDSNKSKTIDFVSKVLGVLLIPILVILFKANNDSLNARLNSIEKNIAAISARVDIFTKEKKEDHEKINMELDCNGKKISALEGRIKTSEEITTRMIELLYSDIQDLKHRVYNGVKK